MISLANYSKHINDPVKSLGDKYWITGCPIEWVERYQAGEDHLVKVTLPNGEKIVGVLDGHGEPKSQFVSYISGSLLVDLVLENWERLRVEKEDRVKKILLNIFRTVSDRLSENMWNIFDIKTCGTTVSLALIMNREGNRHLISANVGDSPIVWYSDGNLTECGFEHNCDNKEAVELYLERMEKRGKPPKQVVFSRINCGGIGDPVWDANCDGNPQPLSVFNYEKNKAVLHQENYNKLVRFYPNGCQSCRYPPTETREGVTRVKEGHECENWGSTLEGGLQLLNSLGDLTHQEDISDEPYISIREINEEGILLVASDGFTDLCTLEKWFKFFSTLDLKDSKSLDEIINKIFSLSVLSGPQTRDEMFIYRQIGSKRYPEWDDVSAVILSLDPFHNGESTS